MIKLVSIVWLIFITILSHTPGDRSSAESRWLSAFSHIDEGVLRRGAHVVCFGVLMCIALLGWGKWAAFFVVAWSVVDEYSKPFIRGRHADFKDWLLNAAGCALGCAAWLLVGVLL